MSKYVFKDQKTFDLSWRNNGLYTEEVETKKDGQAEPVKETRIDKISMKDALAHPDAGYFFPMTVENLVREAVEPLLIGSRLLQRINYKAGMQLTLPSVGAMYAADIDEGMEYPERTLNFGTGYKVTTIGKSGLAIALTEEMIRYSQYDVVNMNLRAAGKAMARHKEQKTFAMFRRFGTVTHDNVTPGSSIFGVTGGRSLSGAGNGSMILDDLFYAYGQVMMNGFTPNAVVVHPLTFTMWATDPVLRAFALQNGGGSWFFGKPGILNQDPWPQGMIGGLGANGGTEGTHPFALAGNYTALNKYNQGLSEGVQFPSYSGLPLTVIVSPFVPYNPQTRLTDIYLVDTNNAGAIIVDEDPRMDEVSDLLRDTVKLKIRERYALAPLNEGHAVAVLKNVKVTANQLITPVQATAGPVAAIAPGTAVVDNTGAQINDNGKIV